jgi:2-oxoglutarate dehydrogenase E2 component (dihydrolipoamide succinyltransferase)
MLIQVKVPSVGESITEGLLAEWLKKDGDYIQSDDPLFVLETDKVTMPIHAEHSGRLKILVQSGEIVKIGQIVGELDTSVKMEPTSPRAHEPQKEEREAARQAAAPPMHPPAGMPQMRAKLSAASLEALSPAVRRMVEEFKVDPSAIPGSGKGGRVTKEDVVLYLKNMEPESRGAGEPGKEKTGTREGRAATTTELPTQSSVLTPQSSVLSPQSSKPRRMRTALSPIRQRIAERLLLSQQTTATLTTFAEADMFEVIALRAESKESFKAKHGVGLGFMSFIVKAAVDGLQASPALRSFIEGGDLVENNYYDIGIAVSTERGLVVPVLRDADTKGFAELERDIAKLAERARSKSLTLPELEGAVFSITNAGSYGALFGTPILNPPQSGVLGTYAIRERPVLRNAQIVPRPMMYLALSYDHRVVDGETAGRFLMRVAEGLEHPGKFLLDAEL